MHPRRLPLLAVTLYLLLGPGGAEADDKPPTFPAEKLDEMVAPVALYPDPILSQVMTAASFPDQAKAANKWAQDHKDVHGQELSDQMTAANFDWDASVQALVPFPTVLEGMTRDSEWLEDFGNAVLAQRGDLMDAIQRMRKKALEAGNLKSSEQFTVKSVDNVIEIQPADPQVIYVPVYDPAVVYAPAPPPSSGGSAAGAAVFGFMAGVMVAEMFDDDWYGGCGFYWGSHTVVVSNCAWGRTWSNRYAYRAPYPPRPVYRGNVNVNVNRNVNNIDIDNRNVNIDNSKRGDVNVGNKNIDAGGNDRRDGNAGRDAGGINKAETGARPAAGQTVTRPGAGSGGQEAKPASSKAKTQPGSAARGYERSSDASSKSALSGSQNGRSETKASARGKASSSSHASSAGSRSGGARGGR